jgi:mRNA interferase MazF
MLTSGDVVDLDLGRPEGREAGYWHPAIVLTAQRILDVDPSVIQVVPLTTTLRGFRTEVELDPDEGNGLTEPSAAQVQHLRSVSPARVRSVRGNVGLLVVTQLRELAGVLLDVPR